MFKMKSRTVRPCRILFFLLWTVSHCKARTQHAAVGSDKNGQEAASVLCKDRKVLELCSIPAKIEDAPKLPLQRSKEMAGPDIEFIR